MIFGLNQGSNAEEDLKEVNKILQAIDLNIPNKKANCFKASYSSKSSPVQVVLNSKEDKIKVLKAAKKLKENPEFKGIYINADFTKTELDLTKSLNEERKNRNSALPHGEGGKKYGFNLFGNDTDPSKFFWGIRDFELIKIKCK